MEVIIVKNTELLETIERYGKKLGEDEIAALAGDLLDHTKPMTISGLKELGIKSMELNNALICCCYIEFCMSNGINPVALLKEDKWSLMRLVARVKSALTLGRVAA